MKNYALFVFTCFCWHLAQAQVNSATPPIPATQTTFQACPSTNQQSAIANWCPSLEGTTLPGCCPPLHGTAIACQYVNLQQFGQATLVNSTYTTCEGGQNVQHTCCAASRTACYTDPVTLKFIPPLIGLSGSNACCFAPCPDVSYWTAPPANPQITDQNTLNGGNAVPQCTTTTVNACQYGSAANCPASSPCQVPTQPTQPTPPNQPTDPSSPSGPSTPTAPAAPAKPGAS